MNTTYESLIHLLLRGPKTSGGRPMEREPWGTKHYPFLPWLFSFWNLLISYPLCSSYIYPSIVFYFPLAKEVTSWQAGLDLLTNGLLIRRRRGRKMLRCVGPRPAVVATSCLLLPCEPQNPKNTNNRRRKKTFTSVICACLNAILHSFLHPVSIFFAFLSQSFTRFTTVETKA